MQYGDSIAVLTACAYRLCFIAFARKLGTVIYAVGLLLRMQIAINDVVLE